jgi:hypothetical protein
LESGREPENLERQPADAGAVFGLRAVGGVRRPFHRSGGPFSSLYAIVAGVAVVIDYSLTNGTISRKAVRFDTMEKLRAYWR